MAKLAVLIAAVLLGGLLVWAGVSYASMEPLSEPLLATEASGSESLGTQVSEVIQELLRAYPGLSVAAAVEDRLVWVGGFGFADVEDGVPVTPATQFRIYSLSKPLTAMAAAQLWQRDRLDLDAPVGRYLGMLPNPIATVTSRQLAGHLSGVRHYDDGEWMRVSTTPCATVAQALPTFVDDPLVHAPEEDFSYSSYGYVLLSAVVEAAAGEPFTTYMQDHLFDAVSMRATRMEPQADLLSKFYVSGWLGRVREAPEVDNTCKWGGGAFVSTASDLAQFGAALMSGAIVDSTALDTLFAPMQTATGESTGYAFGWGVGEDEAGHRYAAHSGGAIGGRSALVLYPDAGISVAILGNIEGESLIEAASQIADLLLDRDL